MLPGFPKMTSTPCATSASSRASDPVTVLPAAPAEDLQEEQEHVEDVEEDPQGDRHRGVPGARTAEPLEVEHRPHGEDREAEDRVDQPATGDVHEDQHDAEHDQPQQCPEGDARERGEIAPCGVAPRPEAGDEQPGGARGLPQHLRAAGLT